MKELKISDIELSGIEAVVFDLDGTLYNRKWLPLRLIFGDLWNARLLASERNARRLLKGLEFGSPEVFYTTLFRHMSRRQNIPYMRARDWYFGQYMPLTVSMLKKYYKAGDFVVPLITQLHERGIKVAVFSDYRCVDEKLQALGLDPNLFDYRVAAPEIGGLKPNKQLFLRLLKLMDVEPKKALMIGDRLDTDGEGAAAVGMKFQLV